jgi:hypothetical protein
MKFDYEILRKSAIWLLRLESLIIFGLLFYLLIASLNSKVTSWPALISEMFFALLGSIGLFISSTSYVKEKSFGRSPAVLANLIALGVSYFMISGHLFALGIPLALLAFATLVAAIGGYREAK